jgi:hypothetical protein
MSDRRAMSSDRRSFLLVVIVLLIGSLVAAFVLFYFLDSYAKIENKEISLRGAAAGFVVVFILLRDTYFKVTKTERTYEGLSDDEKLKALQTQIDQLVTNKFDNFVIPQGYKSEISKEYEFGFCYPEHWIFTKQPESIQYGIAKDSQSGVNRNFVISISEVFPDYDLSSNSAVDKLYKANLEVITLMLQNAKIVSDEECLFNGLHARKTRINFTIADGAVKLSGYLLQAAKKETNKLFQVNFTSAEAEFDSNKPIFDDIITTFRM